MKNKSKRINIRLTAEEHQTLTEKSKNYPSLSSFIIDACEKIDDRRGIKNIDFLMSFLDVYSKWEQTFSRTAGNINQIAHYANMLKQNGTYSDRILEAFLAGLDRWNDCLEKIVSLENRIEKTVRKL